MTRQRLQKVLAAAGIDSRRKCEQLILSGRVCVNSTVVSSLPAFADPEVDVITLDSKRIRPVRKVYFLLNKPKGVICTNRDPQGRRRAIDLVGCRERVFCAGRLDADTTGLIILTNDSELANRLTHPRYKLTKTYVASVKGRIDPEIVEKLKRGIWLAEGKSGPVSVKVLKRGGSVSLLEVTIKQGLNRQIRRILAKVDLPVKSLKRTRIGRINDRGLGTGSFRTLTKSEIEYLRRATASPAQPRRKRHS